MYKRQKLDRLAAYPGEKFCELKLGVKKENGRLVACDYFDREVWFRGIADLVILHGNRAFVLDYKTGKSAKYADLRQIALMAAALFLKHDEIETAKGALAFVVPDIIVRETYRRENALDIFSLYHEVLEQRAVSYETNVWNPKPNGLCGKWCGAKSCEHNGANR